jgi:hypothetical protein
MKYFVLGALASGILLYGMSMIYGRRARSTSPSWREACGRAATGRSCVRARVRRLGHRASSSAPFRTTCGFRTFTTARRRR